MSTGERSHNQRRRSGRRPGTIWFLIFLLLAALASWILGRRDHDHDGSSGPEDLAPRLVSFDGGSDVRRITFAPPTPPPSGGAASSTAEEADSAPTFAPERRGSPAFGPLIISGRVLDAHGAPCEDLEVRLLRAHDTSSAPGLAERSEVDVALTNREGHYFFQSDGNPAELRIAARDATGALHATLARRVRPWRPSEFPDLRLLPTPRRRIRVTLAGGTGPAFGAQLRVRLRPPEGAAGARPVQINDELLLPSWRSPGARARVPASGLVDIDGIGTGDWEIVVVAREHAPRRLALEGRGDLEVSLPLADFEDLECRRSGGRVWLCALDSKGQRWLLPSADDGVLTAPRAWLSHPHSRLWRAGAAPLALTELQRTPSGGVLLPLRGRVASQNSEAPPGWRVDARASFPGADIITEIDRDLGADLLPYSGFDRRLAPGLWTFRLRDDRDRLGPESRIEVEAGRPLDLTLSPPTSAERVVDLRIVDALTGLPVASADATLVREGEDPDAALRTGRVLVRSDTSGGLRFAGVPAGPLTLAIGAPRHIARAITLQIPDAEDARLEQDIELQRARAEIEIQLRDENGRPYADLDAILIDARGTVTPARSDANGRIVFVDLAARPQALFAARGAERLPLDDWGWLSRDSGAPRIEPRAGERVHRDWILPRARRQRITLRIEDVQPDTNDGRTHLTLIGPPEGLGPGLRPVYDLGACRPGELEIGPVFSGSYRVIGRRGERLAVTEVTLSSDDAPPADIRLSFESP